MIDLDACERLLATSDAAVLRQLGSSHPDADLSELLDQAQVVQPFEVPADVVRLGATVEVEDLVSRRRQIWVMCTPQGAEPGQGKISVLSPVGLALIGLRSGATAHWLSPTGMTSYLRVVSVWPPPQE